MRRVLDGFIGNGIQQYLDDLIVNTYTEEEHYQLLTKLFQRLTEYGVKLRKEKCHFFQNEVEFLGFVVSSGVVKPSPTKVKAIFSFPQPKSVKNVLQFLGIGNYFRHLIKNFADTAEPLIELTRKGILWQWTERQEIAFKTLRELFADIPRVNIFEPDKPLVLQTDASGVGLGAVLWQRHDEELKAISYFSATLNQHERRYAASELELLAVGRAIEHYNVYLCGTHFTIWTDCRALKFLFSIENPSSRLFRWTLRLQPYSFTVEYKPGSENQLADAFSRNPTVSHININDFALTQHEIN